jgi:predicted nucleic acid-binding protein
LIVADASAVVAALLHQGQAREMLSNTPCHAPHLLDLEVASVLRRLCLGGQLESGHGAVLLEVLGRLGIRRHGCTGLLGRIWQLRNNLTTYDAAYFALAEVLDCPLLTADGKLSNAAPSTCVIHLVPG